MLPLTLPQTLMLMLTLTLMLMLKSMGPGAAYAHYDNCCAASARCSRAPRFFIDTLMDEVRLHLAGRRIDVILGDDDNLWLKGNLESVIR